MNKERLLSIIKTAPYGDGHVFGDIMLPDVMNMLVDHLLKAIGSEPNMRYAAKILPNNPEDLRPTMTLDSMCGSCESLVLSTDRFCASCGAALFKDE